MTTIESEWNDIKDECPCIVCVFFTSSLFIMLSLLFDSNCLCDVNILTDYLSTDAYLNFAFYKPKVNKMKKNQRVVDGVGMERIMHD
jgi:hypothetical protein